MKWVADGIISPGEYPAIVKPHSDYAISWRSDGQFIYVAMQAKTAGFVAVGFKPTQFMMNADMVFGFVKNGQASIYDMYSTGEFGPHPPDTDLGGTNDIIEFGGKEEGGDTTIEFKRALNTGDKYDQPLLPGTNKIIWSYGLNDEITQKHVVRGSGEIGL